MKRLLLTLLALVFATNTLLAQRNHQQGWSDESKSVTYQDKAELHRFEELLDQFSFAMLTGNPRAARYSKHEILLAMDKEIDQAKRRLKNIRYAYRSNSYSKRRYDWGIPRMESKRNGIRNYSQREVAELVHRIEKQERLYHQFVELDLQRRRNGRIINEDDHRRIMYRFAETMRDDIYGDNAQRRSTTTRRGNK